MIFLIIILLYTESKLNYLATLYAYEFTNVILIAIINIFKKKSQQREFLFVMTISDRIVHCRFPRVPVFNFFFKFYGI